MTEALPDFGRIPSHNLLTLPRPFGRGFLLHHHPSVIVSHAFCSRAGFLTSISPIVRDLIGSGREQDANAGLWVITAGRRSMVTLP